MPANPLLPLFIASLFLFFMHFDRVFVSVLYALKATSVWPLTLLPAAVPFHKRMMQAYEAFVVGHRLLDIGYFCCKYSCEQMFWIAATFT